MGSAAVEGLNEQVEHDSAALPIRCIPRLDEAASEVQWVLLSEELLADCFCSPGT